MSWTDQRIDQLKNLWEKGLTASQIADELGGVSRNAVIGKAHRLGLKSRPSPVKANEAEKKVAPKKAAPPVYGPDEVSGPIVFARPGNAPETFLLYDDIVMLSSMNDRDGLLISLERLLILAKLEDHVRVFIDANEPKLVGLYEAQLKSFSKVPRRKMPAIDNTMPRVFLRGEKIAAVLAVIDGKATVSEIVQKVTTFTRIETLSCLAQMQRAGMIDV